jgi:hypothetical protein
MNNVRIAVYNTLSRIIGKPITKANDEQTLFSLGVKNGQFQIIIEALKELGFETSATFQENPTVEDLVFNFEDCLGKKIA